MTTNLIYYGPPGTGKTHETAHKAVLLCDGAFQSDYPEGSQDWRTELMQRYQQLRQEERIAFVTFHQNFSYEDFIEGLRPQTHDTAGTGFSLVPTPGIFREAVSNALRLFPRDFKFYEMKQGRFNTEDIFLKAIEDGYAYYGGNLGATDCFLHAMKKDDIIIVTNGNDNFRAIGIVTGDLETDPEGYCIQQKENNKYGVNFIYRRKVNWIHYNIDKSSSSSPTVKDIPVDNILKKDMHFATENCTLIQTDKINGKLFQNYLENSSEKDFETHCKLPHVLIIDEINRANISRVFGELITLLEPEKRLGKPDELTVRLPYSREDFGVPDNIHIIGTMNTADRSIALLDTALRRRFDFHELMPDPEKLRPVSEKIKADIDLPLLLKTLNQRIEYLFDREHQIGHAYFMGCTDRADVDRVMRDRVIPLLSEYFYEDWNKVAAILGDADEGEGDHEGGFLNREKLPVPRGLPLDGDSAARYRWRVRTVEEKFYYDRGILNT